VQRSGQRGVDNAVLHPENLIDDDDDDDNDNDNDVYFTLATSDSRIGKYKTVGEQLTHKNRSIYNAIWIIKRDYVGMVESWIS